MMKFQYCLIVILLCTSHFSIAQTRKSINTVKKTLVRNATINGHLYQDTNGNGTQDAMEPNLRNVDLLLNQSDGSFQIVSTDVFGDWIALTPSGNTVVKIDQNDLPPLSGRIQTEGKDPSQVTAVMSQNTSAGNDGFFYVGTVAGRLYHDKNGNGQQNTPLESGIANITIKITDLHGNSYVATTNATGDWAAKVGVGLAIIAIDSKDPDFLKGVVIQSQGINPANANVLLDQTTVTIHSGFYIQVDTDGDGLFDHVEVLNGTDPTNSCDPTNSVGYRGYVPSNNIWRMSDCDGDGITNGQEFSNNTDPYNPCSPMPPATYTAYDRTNKIWLEADCDNDGLTNAQEIAINTNPFLADTDGDGLNDRIEVLNLTNPLDSCSPVQAIGYTAYDATNFLWRSSDCDGDGIINGNEFINKTDPFNPCSPILESSYTGYNINNNIWFAADCDGDGLTNGEEVRIKTNPFLADTDGDGITDGLENLNGTDPLNPCSPTPASTNTSYVATNTIWGAADCDGDGLSNGQEIRINTNPFLADTDGDGINDGSEFSNGSNPLNPCSPVPAVNSSTYVVTNTIWLASDCDGDGLTNGQEIILKTNPFDRDTDGDGISDGDENTNRTNPLNPCSPAPSASNTSYVSTNTIWLSSDCDGDGLSNGEEVRIKTNPFLADTDGDGITDGLENLNGTDPLNPCSPTPASTNTSYVSTNTIWGAADCDGDGLSNGQEIRINTNPFLADTDGDGINDGLEIKDKTNPLDSCSPVNTIGYLGFNPTNAIWQISDCDGDGLTNQNELVNKTDPYDPCSPEQLKGYMGYDSSNPLWQEADCDDDGVNNNDEHNNTTDPYDGSDNGLIIYTGLSPNGDKKNDFFVIAGINSLLNNQLSIFNRWGVEVFNASNYQNDFDGKSRGRITIKQNEMLPTGTYYFKLNFTRTNGVEKQISGYLYIN